MVSILFDRFEQGRHSLAAGRAASETQSNRCAYTAPTPATEASPIVRYRRLQGFLAGRRDAVDSAPVIVRSSLDPAFRRHAGNGVFARRVQFLNGESFGRAHTLQGSSFH